MSYEIDRNPAVEPSLVQMVNKTLQILTKATEDSEKGFFLMIEGSRIDMAAHRYKIILLFIYFRFLVMTQLAIFVKS
jgi:alkaline phosphatase